jgi:alpha 1,3-glucosidase
MRLRRSSEMMKNDPYTLFIALDDSKEASGKLFLDDEKSFDYTTGKYDYRNFVFSQDTLKNVKIHEGTETFQCTGWIERLVFMGVERGIKAVKVLDEAGGSRDLEFTYDERTKVAVVRKPDLGLGEEWSVVITEV